MIYVASKAKYWPWWQALRSASLPINASWIDAPFNRDGYEPILLQKSPMRDASYTGVEPERWPTARSVGSDGLKRLR
jgi:hypothetical protein